MSNETQDQVVEDKQEASAETPVEEAKESLFEDDDNSAFLETIPEEYRNEPAIKNHKNVASLAKSYLHAQKEIGGRVRIPAADAPPEVKAEFYAKVKDIPNLAQLPDVDDPEYDKKVTEVYAKLGRPEKPDDYELTLDPSLPIDEEYAKSFKEKAHQMGLSNKQVKELSALESERGMAMTRMLDKQKDGVMAHLKSQWGDKYKENIQLARGVLSKYEDRYPDAARDIRKGYAGTNVILIEALYELSQVNREEPTMAATDNEKVQGLTTESVQSKIDSIMRDTKGPLYDATHPDHDKALAEVNALYAQKASLKKQDNS